MGPMSPLQAIGVFIGIPLLIYAVVWLIVYARWAVKGPKYRPGVSWWAEPIWLGGGDVSAVAMAEPLTETGGCSARW